MEGDLDKAESKLSESKAAQEEGETTKANAEGLQRKIQLLEEELDAAEKNAKEVVEKYVTRSYLDRASSVPLADTDYPVARDSRLRQVDVKAEHFERQVQRVEQERDAWEKKYEVRLFIFPLDSLPLLAKTFISIHRKHKRSIASRRRSWTSSLQTWKASNLTRTVGACSNPIQPIDRITYTHTLRPSSQSLPCRVPWLQSTYLYCL